MGFKISAAVEIARGYRVLAPWFMGLGRLTLGYESFSR